ncbi:unnamed protein product [Cercopithifilaria johnstoni]|uniref:Uncharacterized protein n=1 Tax=Cercopithifilaria johnstoni TaxID=2874296 RepID=A0A8J2MFN5_9BILA|nr:unnamed protein product [Cercopithifilaria johnstoni]
MVTFEISEQERLLMVLDCISDLNGISWLTAPSNPTCNDMALDKTAPNNANSSDPSPLHSYNIKQTEVCNELITTDKRADETSSGRRSVDRAHAVIKERVLRLCTVVDSKNRTEKVVLRSIRIYAFEGIYQCLQDFYKFRECACAGDLSAVTVRWINHVTASNGNKWTLCGSVGSARPTQQCISSSDLEYYDRHFITHSRHLIA